MDSIERAVIKLGLSKFQFKRFAPVLNEKSLEKLIGIWLESLVRERVTAEEFSGAVSYLADNKPEWPDVADVILQVKKQRAERFKSVQHIGIEGPDGRYSHVAIDSPEALQFFKSREQQQLPSPEDLAEVRKRLIPVPGEENEAERRAIIDAQKEALRGGVN